MRGPRRNAFFSQGLLPEVPTVLVGVFPRVLALGSCLSPRSWGHSHCRAGLPEGIVTSSAGSSGTVSSVVLWKAGPLLSAALQRQGPRRRREPVGPCLALSLLVLSHPRSLLCVLECHWTWLACPRLEIFLEQGDRVGSDPPNTSS